jgi:hypothetical protein
MHIEIEMKEWHETITTKKTAESKNTTKFLDLDYNLTTTLITATFREMWLVTPLTRESGRPHRLQVWQWLQKDGYQSSLKYAI